METRPEQRIVPVLSEGDRAHRESAARTELRAYLDSASGRAEAMKVARKFLASEEDAFDAVQDASVRVIEAAHLYDPSRRFVPWFLRILAMICLQVIRKTKSRGALLSLDNVIEGVADGDYSYVDALPDTDASVEDQVFSSVQQHYDLDGIDFTSKRMHASLHRLPKLHRDVLIMRYIQRLERHQVADHLGQSLGALGELTTEAQKLLRRYYALYEGLDEA